MKFSRIPRGFTPKLRGWRRSQRLKARKSLRRTPRRGLRQKYLVRTEGGEGLQPRRSSKPRRIGKHWENKPAVIETKSGREYCNPGTLEGRAEYAWRTFVLWIRQERHCCICCEYLSLKDATFEHEDSRTKARKDERLWRDDGEPMNGVSHMWCNKLRGSKRTPIFHYPQLERGDFAMIDTVTEEQAREAQVYIEGRVCVCTRAKEPNAPFCEDCHGRIGNQRRHELETMQGPRYIRALELAKRAATGRDVDGAEGVA